MEITRLNPEIVDRSGADSDVFVSYNRELCRKYKYENGACIKIYRRRDKPFVEALKIYTEAMDFASKHSFQLALDIDSKIPVCFIAPDLLTENEDSYPVSVSEYIPGYNFNSLLRVELIGNDRHRQLANAVQKLKSPLEQILSQRNITGATLDTLNFKFSEDNLYSICTDIGANITNFRRKY